MKKLSIFLVALVACTLAGMSISWGAEAEGWLERLFKKRQEIPITEPPTPVEVLPERRDVEIGLLDESVSRCLSCKRDCADPIDKYCESKADEICDNRDLVTLKIRWTVDCTHGFSPPTSPDNDIYSITPSPSFEGVSKNIVEDHLNSFISEMIVSLKRNQNYTIDFSGSTLRARNTTWPQQSLTWGYALSQNDYINNPIDAMNITSLPIAAWRIPGIVWVV